MISTLEKEITFRFLKARKKDGFLNVISIFSFIGIGLGVAVLIIVMSVMNGFRTELINKIVGFNAHITVDPYQNKIEFDQVNSNLQSISKNLILSNSGEAIIIQSEISKGILLRGYNSKDFSKLEIFNKKNILIIDLFKTPIDFRIAISRVLFLTNIVKPEIILKAATIMIKDNIINITFLSTFNAENKELFMSAHV